MSDENLKGIQGYGKAMIYIACFLSLALLLSWGFSDLLYQKYNPNQQVQTDHNKDGSQSVVLRRNGYGHYVSSGKINGQSVDFLLDTGATEVSIPSSVADKLHLQKGSPFAVNTANGLATVYKTEINSISLGNIRLNNISAHINPYMDGQEILLGMSFLKHLEFSQRGNKLTLRQYY